MVCISEYCIDSRRVSSRKTLVCFRRVALRFSMCLALRSLDNHQFRSADPHFNSFHAKKTLMDRIPITHKRLVVVLNALLVRVFYTKNSISLTNDKTLVASPLLYYKFPIIASKVRQLARGQRHTIQSLPTKMSNHCRTQASRTSLC